MKKSILFISLFTFLSLKALPQTIPVGSYAETLARSYQLLGGSDSLSSFTIRPLNSNLVGIDNPSFQKLIASDNITPNTQVFGSELIIKALPADWLSQYNPTRPYGYNNGSLYPNVGYQARLSTGFFIKAGILNIQIEPEVVLAHNGYFGTFAEVWGYSKNPQLLNAYFFVVNGIDAPERFGASSLSQLYPGQTKATLIYKGIEFGGSTENLWWGPGFQNSIMMSNSAPGFLHWTFNSAKPIKTPVGSFEWQLIGGRLRESGVDPLDKGTLMFSSGDYIPKPEVSRYLSAFEFNWQPKWIKGFFVGASSYSYSDENAAYENSGFIQREIPVLSPSLNKQSGGAAGDAYDDAFAINIRKLLPEYNAEFYLEWARNDRITSLNDFLQEPEHSRAYTIGGIKIFALSKTKFIQVRLESTNLENPSTFLVRPEPSWYIHSGSPRDGYTNEGRYLGAGIGPGSSSEIADVSLINGLNSFGISVERLRHNNDLFYSAFQGTSDFDYNWVDINTSLYTKIMLEKNFLIAFNFTFVHTLNYEYYTVPVESENISHSFSTTLNLSYLFD